MKISLLEPIGISAKAVEELAAKLVEAGHEFEYFDTKTTDKEELYERSKDSDIVMIANNPYPAEVISLISSPPTYEGVAKSSSSCEHHTRMEALKLMHFS